MRESRKEELKQHVDEVNGLLKRMNGDVSNSEESDSEAEEEWDGIEEETPVITAALPINHEDEYIDEEKYTTVTISTMDLSKHGLDDGLEEKESSDEEEEEVEEVAETKVVKEKPRVDKNGKRIWTRENPNKKEGRVRKKKRNFRYESKADRRMTRYKERSKNKKQATERKGKET
jgi:ribosomal RNA-processing protein 17